MISRLLKFILMTTLLFILQISFFASFQGPLQLTPFVFVICVYVIQHLGLKDAAGWLVLYGILLEFSGVSPFVGVSLAYAAAAYCAHVSAQHLFSHRSFYGVVACFLLSFAVFHLVAAGLFLAQMLLFKARPLWGAFGADLVARLWVGLLFLCGFFVFAKHLRRFFIRAGLLPPLKTF